MSSLLIVLSLVFAVMILYSSRVNLSGLQDASYTERLPSNFTDSSQKLPAYATTAFMTHKLPWMLLAITLLLVMKHYHHAVAGAWAMRNSGRTDPPVTEIV